MIPSDRTHQEGVNAPAPELAGRRIVRILLVAWCCFIVYDSLIPHGRGVSAPATGQSN